MNGIFKNSENNRTSEYHVLVLKLNTCQILLFVIHGKT